MERSVARKAISNSVRFKVFDRDGFKCGYCGRTPPVVILEVDHIQPVSQGGNNGLNNLLTSCFECNRGKGKRPLGSVPPVDYQGRSDVLKEKAQQIIAYQEHLARYTEAMDELIDLVGGIFWASEGPDQTWSYKNSTSERLQVSRFIEKLGVESVRDAARIASDKMRTNGWGPRWKYFCGICWNWIRQQSSADEGRA